MNDQLIGNYKILKKIGAGGMAKVYLGVHKDVPNLKVILKVLSDGRLVERFKQEADKLALLDGNPNICRIKHFFNHGEDIVIAMEYIEGITLEEHIINESKLSVTESFKIIKEVLKVLDFAHSKGIYHRDIKPSNIMLDKSGIVKIIDFGIAKAESDPNLTVEGTAAGTPAYMAPEQFTPSEKTNYALIDIYSVGTTLFFMLSGELPFKGDNPFAIRDAKLFNDPPLLKSIIKGIPKEIEHLTQKAIQKNPTNRFLSAIEMIENIDMITNNKERTKPDIKTVPNDKKKPSSQIKNILIASAIIIATIATILILFLNSKNVLQIPILSSPLNGAELTDSLPTLVWNNTDYNNYNIEYANNEDFFISEKRSNLTTNRYKIVEPLELGTYYWRVQSIDGEIFSEFSETGYFIVKSYLPPHGMLKIVIEPKGNIIIDDSLISNNATDIIVTLDTGMHKITLINNQAQTKSYSNDIYIFPDSTITLHHKFQIQSQKDQPTKVSLGKLRIGSIPTIGASIYINNKDQNQTTPRDFNLPLGRHIIKGILNVDGELITKIDTVFIKKVDSLHTLKLDFQK